MTECTGAVSVLQTQVFDALERWCWFRLLKFCLYYLKASAVKYLLGHWQSQGLEEEEKAGKRLVRHFGNGNSGGLGIVLYSAVYWKLSSGLPFYLYLVLLFFNWNIVDLQHCNNHCYTAEWFSYMHKYTLFLHLKIFLTLDIWTEYMKKNKDPNKINWLWLWQSNCCVTKHHNQWGYDSTSLFLCPNTSVF